jgi:hypothetical protein
MNIIETFGFLQELNDSVEVFKQNIEIQHELVPTVVFALFTFMTQYESSPMYPRF